MLSSAVILSLICGGCTSLGTVRLAHDQVDYSRAVERAQKRQTLANIVGLRYADTPSFLSLTQIIAAYVFDESAALSGSDSSGSVGFFELIHALRRLQLKRVLTVRFEKDASGNRVFMAVDPARADDADVARDAQHARRLLKIPAGASEIEVVYGAVPENGNEVGIVTRSVIGILTELGAQIEVPDADVARHATVPTVRLLNVETRPTVIIHVGDEAPVDAYGDVLYQRHHYWIDRGDFDSKFAFSVVQNLIALAEASQDTKAPIVTIPAN